MNITIIGCNGQLGHDMVSACAAEGHRTQCIDRPDIDITDRALTEKKVREADTECIINCSAYTAVDACETNEKTAYAINADGVANIARAAKLTGASVVHISTDYVFDGTKTIPYVETDAANPQSVYGKSKLAGENYLMSILDKHYIFRIAWLYGKHGANFVKTIRTLARQRAQKRQPLFVVNDQLGAPTCTKDVCRQVLTLLSRRPDQYGLYHCSNKGICSWYEFACYIVKMFNIDAEIKPCTTAEFPRPAQRPAFSVLENHRLVSLGIHIMPHWKEAFNRFIKEIQESDL